MRKPITAIILSLIVGMLMLTGCQQEDAAQEEGPVTLKLARFFGDCDDTTKGVTDVSKATTECEVIQILTNKFNAENGDGITIERLGGAEWGTYYDALNTSFAGGDPPDVAVVHGSNLPDYADRGLLMPLDDLYAEAGIDFSDWTVPAQNAVKYDGVGYGVAFDLHASLDHVNVDIFKEAGLVDANGDPIRPTSPEEFMAQAEKVKEATGAYYFVTDASQFPFSARLLVTLVYQQGSSLISEDGKKANVNTPEARKAVEFMLELFEKGYANPDHNYTAAQEAFLDGNAAIM
ncbi:MAG: ABC transporter substrate-binding protein, partial [Sediminispirochaetaceae bacterium]